MFNSTAKALAALVLCVSTLFATSTSAVAEERIEVKWTYRYNLLIAVGEHGDPMMIDFMCCGPRRLCTRDFFGGPSLIRDAERFVGIDVSDRLCPSSVHSWLICDHNWSRAWVDHPVNCQQVAL